jgi:hypothetical protein
MLRKAITAALALSSAFGADVRAQDWAGFSSAGLPGSRGVVVQLRHPATWKKVVPDDDMALAELRGPSGALTGILQVGRGRKRTDMQALCHPGRASTMLQDASAQESGVRITDVVARATGDRPGFEVRYERNDPPDSLLVRSRIVCLKDSRLVVSCGASGAAKASLAAIEPVCTRVFESLRISEE